MRRLIRYALAAGEAALLKLVMATPVLAQTATPSSESTGSALPEAGTASTTLLILVFGVVVVSTGLILFRRSAPQEVKI
ncbi:MAG: hypothetical protein A2900_02645 [Candidatus Chisholmbacteria bacterium RIFCSPLOWO2_01_FULL_50_28]|uniref:Gram-positive cocci surface proteins LPxTG domain-containing protein n=1 Tax=Candidatus Chisholmbacteria bacterium RIFCSPHIGHO2_01_FULL_52_32 TaxID=1797591 RepID=A0A1G1VTB2_9BACT|nr:MAG: hypothetical protein A2786_04100 [Candidatus Chisholmbacteria bacterium RIFCSPHIGHO2_01_FULL_52_32]OGY19977.1 MAG: hypothetical protein A2900_02645 [Candidatus Chisholmbacteria bacterium RIFCSPLOWO2_01_FULL_50_28]